jgi:hypothetical protein
MLFLTETFMVLPGDYLNPPWLGLKSRRVVRKDILAFNHVDACRAHPSEMFEDQSRPFEAPGSTARRRCVPAQPDAS